MQAAPPLQRLAGGLKSSLVSCSQRALGAFEAHTLAKLQEEYARAVHLPLGELRSLHALCRLRHPATLSLAPAMLDANAAVNAWACSDAGRACR